MKKYVLDKKNMTESEIIKGKIIVAQYMGLFVQCRNGKSYWVRKSSETEFKRLSSFKYESSWDWQIPLWSKFAKEYKDLVSIIDLKNHDYFYQKYLKMLDKYESAVWNNNPLEGFEIIVENLPFLIEEKENELSKNKL